MNTDVFRSRVDTWLAVALALAAILCVVAAGYLALGNQSGGLLIAAVLILLGVILPLWMMIPTTYTLNDQDLRVVSGPFRWRIPIREIRSVTRTNNPLSSPALSLDRLRIDYGQTKSLMVSPFDKEGFLRALEARRASQDPQMR